MDKQSLSEADICSKFITPAVVGAGWDEMLQVRREVSFTKGRIIVRGKLVTRGKDKISVVGLRLTLLDGSGAVVDLARANVQVLPSGR